MARGGYRQPTNPAPVSGPGQLSRRTDGKQPIMNLPDAGYGENAAFTGQQQGAPLPQVQGVPQASSSPQAAPQPPQVPFGAPTQNAAEPVTSGAAAGPGPGPEALGLGSPVQANWQNARDVVSSLAANPSASPALQAMAARLQGDY